jgi:hypothetical protein
VVLEILANLLHPGILALLEHRAPRADLLPELLEHLVLLLLLEFLLHLGNLDDPDFLGILALLGLLVYLLHLGILVHLLYLGILVLL